jgi:hypothetical protein
MMLMEVQNAETPIFINMKRKPKKNSFKTDRITNSSLRMIGSEILHQE